MRILTKNLDVSINCRKFAADKEIERRFAYNKIHEASYLYKITQVMKIYYSPFFNGLTFIDYDKHKGGLLGEAVESTAGLLGRLELLAGLSYPEEVNETLRQQEYYELLEEIIPAEGDPLSESFGIDRQDVDASKEKETQPLYRVTAELLKWRDRLIMAGWNGESLPEGRLKNLEKAEEKLREKEKQLGCRSVIRRGVADRWRALLEPKYLDRLRKADVVIEVRYPSVLIDKLVIEVIEEVNRGKDVPAKPDDADEALKPEHCTVLTVDEQYQAYEWLTKREPRAKEVVVCRDAQRLDSVLRCHNLPVAGEDPQTSGHHVVNDIRSMLDVPESLVWLDCSGDYGLQYPFDFMTEDERQFVVKTLRLPSREDMLAVVAQVMIRTLNQVPGEVILVKADYDVGAALTEHPLVATLLYNKDAEAKCEKAAYDIPLGDKRDETLFGRKAYYEVGIDARVRDLTASYSSLDQLIQSPFDYVVEREAGLREPINQSDLVTTEGNVAHRVTELMLENGELKSEKFEEALDKALQEDESQLLSQAENQFELETFKKVLKDSIEVLKEIIAENELIPVCCEYPIPEGAVKPYGKKVKAEEADSKDKPKTIKLDVFGKSNAFVDMLLKDKEDNYYIFDFKFSRSDKYSQKLEQNKSVQFAFYEEIFEQWRKQEKTLGPLRAMGYYLFPLGTLFVPEGEKGSKWLKGKHVQAVPQDDKEHLKDALQALRNSYEYRMEELASGKIEEGESMELSDLEYHNEANNPETREMFPLETEYDKENLKGKPYSPKHIVLKGQIR